MTTSLTYSYQLTRNEIIASAYTITLINSLSPGFIRTVSGTDTPVLPGRGFSIRVSPAGDPHEI